MIRRRALWLLSIAVLFCGVVSWYFWPRHYVSAADIQRQLSVRTPIGAPAEQLLGVLDSMGAVHSTVLRGVVTANFGRSSERGLVYGEVFGTFRVDAGGRLASYEVKELFTGP